MLEASGIELFGCPGIEAADIPALRHWFRGDVATLDDVFHAAELGENRRRARRQSDGADARKSSPVCSSASMSRSSVRVRSPPSNCLILEDQLGRAVRQAEDLEEAHELEDVDCRGLEAPHRLIVGIAEVLEVDRFAHEIWPVTVWAGTWSANSAGRALRL